MTTEGEMTATDEQKKIKWGPIGEEVYNRTYSRQTETGWETWPDTVARVVRGSTAVGVVNPGEAERLAELIQDFKVLPAGRHLWITGTGQPYTRNCFVGIWTNRLADHFEFMADQLLTGGGVGSNYSQEYISQTLTLNPFWLRITCSSDHPEYNQVKDAAGSMWHDSFSGRYNVYRIPDMREGWVRAWGKLFDSATTVLSPYHYDYPNINLDVSDIRPSGAEIKTFGGTASGPVPLVKSLVAISAVLLGAIGRHLTSVEAMECDHNIASAVVAGGSRRSSRMSIVHWKDPKVMEFIRCKADHMLHWTTNISVEIDDEFLSELNVNDSHATDLMREVSTGMIMNGEPGFFNVSSTNVGERSKVRSTNPCGEVPLDSGESCLIGSIDLDLFGTDDDEACTAFKLMTRFLIRASLIKPHNPITAEIEARNRRIGVGFLGFQGWAAAHGVRYSDIPKSDVLARKLNRFRTEIREEANRYCDELGINRCIKVTAIAPNGTISQLRGTQPGIHPIIARWFWRRVRFTVGDPLIAEAEARGLFVEPCIYGDNTMVVRYPVQDSILENHPPELIQQADEISLDDQLAVLAFVTNTFCSGSDGNAVSFTANLDTSVYQTADDLVPVLARWLPECKGLTVFPSMSRPQAPYEPISEAEYNSALIEGLQFSGSVEIACAGAACPIR